MKKLSVLVIVVIAVFVFAACSDVNNSELNDITDAVTTESSEVSIPTDSGLADSIFDNVSTPTEAVNDSVNEATDDSTAESVEKDDAAAENKPTTEATVPDTKPEDMTYEAFTALTPAEQRLYQESFKDLDAFFEWYSAAKEKYEQENPPIDIDGPIDLGKV